MSRYQAIYALNCTILSTFPRIASWLLMACFALFLLTGCNSAAEESATQKTAKKPHATGLVSLTQKEIRSGAIVIEPAVRGKSKVHRDFPARVVPDHLTTAAITAVRSGRVVDIS